MSGLVSIYRKDYLWPSPKAYFPRAGTSCTAAAPLLPEAPPAALKCGVQPRPEQVEGGEKPERPLVGQCPRTEPLEFSETDTCLKKVRPMGLLEGYNGVRIHWDRAIYWEL